MKLICEGCKIYMSINSVDNQRLYWTEQLSRTNSELHQKIIYLGRYTSILEKKIANLNEIILLKDVVYASQTFEKEEKNLERVFTFTKYDDQLIINNCLKKFRYLYDQLNNSIEDYQMAKNKFQQVLDKQQKELTENSHIQQEMVQAYRENLFKEMKKHNQLKAWIHNEILRLKMETDAYIQTYKDKLKNELKEKMNSKYAYSIQHCQQQIKNQDELIRKMQAHRRELYIKIKEEKLKQNELKEKYEKNINELEMKIKQLKQKNQNMETLLRLHN